MALFVLTRRSALPPAACLDRLTDWPRHGERVPFTRVSTARGSGRQPGDTVLARTSLGPFVFDDLMEIVELTVPTAGSDGLCRLAKRGRPVRGWAELRVRAGGGAAGGAAGGSVVSWTEEIVLPWLPGFLDPVLACAGRLVFGRVLDRLLS
ncbi:SRPBCC family protein [Kitasatospora sp. NBC_01250]|uniref:SRPBCC family protein n=1 Tax=unclassified Kitasatospora TaxID=2633591 RepID=UPI002E1128D4|nr:MULTISPECIES: SRPBCC family protein [unclassified Kitasatospora]WSJ71498.1 SRPBCC family protein [Kitasatospora sp. NBC_01302]